jgi:hypothetical protein
MGQLWPATRSLLIGSICTAAAAVVVIWIFLVFAGVL